MRKGWVNRVQIRCTTAGWAPPRLEVALTGDPSGARLRNLVATYSDPVFRVVHVFAVRRQPVRPPSSGRRGVPLAVEEMRVAPLLLDDILERMFRVPLRI